MQYVRRGEQSQQNARTDTSETGGEDILLQGAESEFPELIISSNSNVVLAFSLTGFSIPPGEDTLLLTVFVEESVTNVCLEGVVLANPDGQALTFEVGCLFLFLVVCFSSCLPSKDHSIIRRAGSQSVNPRAPLHPVVPSSSFVRVAEEISRT